MAADDVKITNPSNAGINESSLTDEEKKKLEETRIAAETAARNKALTDSISGANNKEELENQYQQIKAKKAELKSNFNELHAKVQVEHSDYTSALFKRAKAGWNKLKKFGIFQASLEKVNTFKSAYTNLTTYGDLKGVNIGTTGINDTKKLTSYVSNQEFNYGKQTKTDLANYEMAQETFEIADNNTDAADRVLTDDIDKERGLVDDMRYADEQLRNNIIAQNYLA